MAHISYSKFRLHNAFPPCSLVTSCHILIVSPHTRTLIMSYSYSSSSSLEAYSYSTSSYDCDDEELNLLPAFEIRSSGEGSIFDSYRRAADKRTTTHSNTDGRKRHCAHPDCEFWVSDFTPRSYITSMDEDCRKMHAPTSTRDASIPSTLFSALESLELTPKHQKKSDGRSLKDRRSTRATRGSFEALDPYSVNASPSAHLSVRLQIPDSMHRPSKSSRQMAFASTPRKSHDEDTMMSSSPPSSSSSSSSSSSLGFNHSRRSHPTRSQMSSDSECDSPLVTPDESADDKYLDYLRSLRGGQRDRSSRR